MAPSLYFLMMHALLLATAVVWLRRGIFLYWIFSALVLYVSMVTDAFEGLRVTV